MDKDFSLDHFRALLQQVEQNGMLEAVNRAATHDVSAVFGQGWSVLLRRLDHILGVMTPEERQSPDKIGPLRRHEIAAQSGVPTDEIDSWLARFLTLRALKRQMDGMTLQERVNLLLFEAKKIIEPG